MTTREPHVAGLFYPDSADECRAELTALTAAASAAVDLPARPVGAIVPHAGWRFSGAVCGRAMRALSDRRTPQTVVIFGADHRSRARTPAAFGSGRWRIPPGVLAVDDELAADLAAAGAPLDLDPERHRTEHSIEVVVPFVLHLWGPGVRILPILVPPSDESAALGERAAAAVSRRNRDAVFIGSSDLTHYGSAYGFTPRGEDESALSWAKDVNDRRVIDLMLTLRAERVVPEVRENGNACGAGAIAATLAAARAAGAARGVLTDHVTSREVFPEAGVPERCVGYAGVVL